MHRISTKNKHFSQKVAERLNEIVSLNIKREREVKGRAGCPRKKWQLEGRWTSHG